MAAAAAVKESLWFRTLFGDLGLPHSGPINVKTDNQASLTLLKNAITSPKSKHIDVIYHLAREKVSRGEVQFSYVPTAEMVADIMTKALPLPKFKYCRTMMGMRA